MGNVESYFQEHALIGYPDYVKLLTAMRWPGELIMMLCAICYHLYNVKQPCKSNTPPSEFLTLF